MFRSRGIAGRSWVAVALLVVLLGLAACGSAATSTPVPPAAPPPQPTSVPPGTAPAPQTVTIEMINTSFSPASIQVKAGTTVVWVNKDPAEHSTTSDSNLWNSGLMAQGATFSFTFSQPGTYSYHCTPHLALGMTGVITVVQ